MSHKLISWAAATIAGLAGPVAITIAALFLASAWPVAQAEAATERICVNFICIDIVEVPDGKLPNGHNRYVTFLGRGYLFNHFDVRTKNGAQIEICGDCGWTFFAQPGHSYSFSVEGCFERGVVDGSSCKDWSVFHYKVAPILGVIIAPPGKALGRAGPTTTGPTTVEGICKSAQAARARNSPAAPGLEARCSAAMAQQAAHQAELAQQVEALPDSGKGAGDHVLANNAAGQGADLTVVGLSGPNTLQAGLSGTYKVTIKNIGDTGTTVELHIIFAKALDQTGQIVAGAGLFCAIGHDAGINAGLNCTGGQLSAGEATTVIVQGRGQSPGGGVLLATLNPGHAVPESNYNNNVRQLNVTIN